MEDIEVKKCGVKFDPPAIVMSYFIKSSGKLHRRTMPLRNFSKHSGIDRAADELCSNPRHEKYIQNVPKAQLLRLLTIIKDKLNGMSLEASIAKNDELDRLDPEEDLNKVDEETLKRKKSIMENTFEKHQIKPGDPDFQYDVEVEFPQNGEVETCDWDSEGSDPDF
ncbi:hypothetical protein KUTeg_012471 [Tegillarca granosa]|uniref:Centrosomal protein of 19 kDa n=1 Tax=Tegillarca granosa TaxID=220873 RepID=A0ABQ9F223_TEGGR|nr:hypothetical protein KUTeg_012471 [Tegillarca granosa]